MNLNLVPFQNNCRALICSRFHGSTGSKTNVKKTFDSLFIFSQKALEEKKTNAHLSDVFIFYVTSPSFFCWLNKRTKLESSVSHRFFFSCSWLSWPMGHFYAHVLGCRFDLYSLPMISSSWGRGLEWNPRRVFSSDKQKTESHVFIPPVFFYDDFPYVVFGFLLLLFFFFIFLTPRDRVSRSYDRNVMLNS